MSHWLYTEKDAKKGMAGQRALVPSSSSIPIAKTSTLLPQKPILTEPQAHCQKSIPSIQVSGESWSESSLGHHPQTLTLEGGDMSNERSNMLSKKLCSSEIVTEKDNGNLVGISTSLTPCVPPCWS